MTSVGWFVVLLALVGAERVAELRVSRRNCDWSLTRGGREFGAGHYPVMVALHSALLVGAAVEVVALDRPFHPGLGWPALAVVVAAQGLRWWCVRTLGPRWNTKVIVVPGLAPIRLGPYARLRHPNYLAVVVEGLALPLVHTAWVTAAGFTVLNAVLLRHRIRVEDAALAEAAGSGPAGPRSTGSAGSSSAGSP
jgi:methyltransferase